MNFVIGDLDLIITIILHLVEFFDELKISPNVEPSKRIKNVVLIFVEVN